MVSPVHAHATSGRTAQGSESESPVAAVILTTVAPRYPTTLIWGRHDLATALEKAEAVSATYGWPLHVIEGAADDPPLEQPEAFLEVLRSEVLAQAEVAR